MTTMSLGQNSDTLSLTAKHKNDSVIVALTKHVLTVLKEQDFNSFVNLIHPILGVRISLEAHIDTLNDVRLSREQFLKEIKKDNILYWGEEDGTGDSILMSVKKYFDGFSNGFWLKAKRVSANKIIERGNTINNLDEVYRGCEFTESNYPGFDEKFGGMDWCSLRLVFKKYKGQFYLVGIINDQWTI